MPADPGLPTVAIIRDPDYADDITLSGEMNVIYVDLGQAFDGPKNFPGDMDDAEARAWIQDHRDEVATLDEHNEARTAVEYVMNDLEAKL